MENEWVDRIILRAKSDPWYLECLNAVNAKEPAFLAVRNILTEEQKEQLDAYISACEELEHSLVYLAYQIGQE